MRDQEIRFCSTKDKVRLAWTVNGDGPVVVKAPNWIGHLELDWRSPAMAPLLTSVAAKYRLVRFDQRGNGLSDWNVKEISFERFVDDLERIFDAAQVERAPILALSQGGAIAAAFAARRPERVSAIVMIGAFPVGRNKRRSKRELEQARALRAMMAAGWDDEFPSLRDLLANVIVPTSSEEERRSYAEDMRRVISPGNVARTREAVDNIDITELLRDVAAPCLRAALPRRQDAAGRTGASHCRRTAERSLHRLRQRQSLTTGERPGLASDRTRAPDIPLAPRQPVGGLSSRGFPFKRKLPRFIRHRHDAGQSYIRPARPVRCLR